MRRCACNSNSPPFVLPKKLTKPNNHVQSVEQFLCTALQMRSCTDFERAFLKNASR
ncbi:hypothetical protein EIQ31_14825 [Agrobacterium deltaense]|nr:hypothetical protein EIQ31_14825 [Agrobacterium deltaense]